MGRGAIDGRPAGVRHVVLICFVIAMVDGYDTVMPSFTAPLIARAFAADAHAIGAFFSIGYGGAFLGSLVAGQLTDRFGRRPVMALFLTVMGLATVSGAMASSLAVLLVIRFVAGLGLGGALPSLFALTAEHSAVRRPAAKVVLMYVGYPVGAVVGGFITSFLLRFGWQAIFVGGGVVGLLMVPLALTVPESLRMPAGGRRAGGVLPRALAQFADGRLGSALLLWLGLFCMLLVTYLLMSWTPTIAVQAGLPLRTAALSAVVLSLGGVLGALALGPLVERHGPFAPAALMIGVGAAALAALGHCFGSAPLLMAALLVVGVTALGGQLVIPAMGVELFPSRVRGTGSGWLMAIGRLGSIVGPVLGGALLADRVPLGRLFLLIGAAAAVAAIAFAVAGRLCPANLGHDCLAPLPRQAGSR
jgi:MFS transporter, AAHS family, 4-hydroxybenzoate transporter